MSSNNDTLIKDISTTPSSIIITLGLIKQYFVIYLPLAFTILGLIGFIGNAITFLQPTLRVNTCCIYLLCGSLIDIINLFLNLLPNYLYSQVPNLLSVITVSSMCKLKLFGLVFLPQLSENLLILTSIDRYACTCSVTSPIRYTRQLKMVPYFIVITIIISGLMSLYGSILHDVVPIFGCISIDPFLNSILYIMVHGFMTSSMMLLFVMLTYRNVRQSRQRVINLGVLANGDADRPRNQFLGMIFTQVCVTSFFILQWIVFYIYFMITQFNNKSLKQWTIDYFTFSLTNNLYYMINVKSFYLSTLTSRLFRKVFVRAVMNMMHVYPYQEKIRKNSLAMNVMKSKRHSVP